MKILTGGYLIDGTGRDPLANAVVMIDDDGKLVYTGKSKPVYPNAEIIDVSGRTIMPGLIDCHVHFFIEIRSLQELVVTPMSLRVIQATLNAKATLDAGVTSVRDALGTPAGFKTAGEKGLIPAPRMRVAITGLTQTGGHGDFHLPTGIRHPLVPFGDKWEWPEGICDGVDEVRKATRAVLRSGADFVKLMSSGGVMSPSDEPEAPQFTREEISVIVEEAKAAGKTAMAHAQSTEGIRNAVECGVESIEHGFFLNEEIIEEMNRRGTFLVPTLQALKAVLSHAEENPDSVMPQSIRKAKNALEAHKNSFKMAVESGVRIAMGTDAGVGEHGTNAEELSLMVENGMTPMQAVVASTKTASECIHMGNDIGTLEQGKAADILVVDGDPLDNISILEDTKNLLMIIQDGKFYKNAIS